MNCVNCGASLDVSKNEKFINCEYCKTKNANFRQFEEIEFLSKNLTLKESCDEDILKTIIISLKLKNYEYVLNISLNLLNNNPSSWIALTYSAIAYFWLGYNDFGHLDEIVAALEKAKIISGNNELVIDASQKIANDIVLLASKNEIYGEELQNAIFAFQTSTKLNDMTDDLKMILLNYCKKSFNYLRSNLDELLKKNKKNYDPPILTLNNIYQLGMLIKDKEIFELFYLHGKYHLNKNIAKSYSNDLRIKIQQCEILLKEFQSDIVGKQITFTLMGSLKII